MYRKSILRALVTVCLMALLCASCRKDGTSHNNKSGAGAGSAESMVKYVPQGSLALAVMNVESLVKSPLFAQEPFKSQLALARSEGDLKMLMDAGVDPFGNLKTIVLVGDPETYRIVAILSGDFDAASAAAALAKSIVNKEYLRPEHKRVAQVVGDNFLLIGTEEAVASAKLGQGLAGSPQLAESFSELSKKGVLYGVMALPKSVAQNAPIPQLQSLASITGSLTMSDGIDVDVSGHFDSPENAAAAKTMIDGFLPMIATQVPKELLSTLSFQVKGTNLGMTLRLEQAQLGGDNNEFTRSGLTAVRMIFKNILGWLLAP